MITCPKCGGEGAERYREGDCRECSGEGTVLGTQAQLLDDLFVDAQITNYQLGLEFETYEQWKANGGA